MYYCTVVNDYKFFKNYNLNVTWPSWHSVFKFCKNVPTNESIHKSFHLKQLIYLLHFFWEFEWVNCSASAKLQDLKSQYMCEDILQWSWSWYKDERKANRMKKLMHGCWLGWCTVRNLHCSSAIPIIIVIIIGWLCFTLLWMHNSTMSFMSSTYYFWFSGTIFLKLLNSAQSK